MSNSSRWRIAQFAERKWWQRYLKNKDVESYLQWKKQYWQNLLNICYKYIPHVQEQSLLDAGCGPAGMFMMFNNESTYAFDPLIDTYEKDLPHFKKAMYSQVHFVNSGLENFSVPIVFDYVFCMNAINHVQDINTSYDTLSKHCKSKGFLIITIDAHNFTLFKKLFRLLPGDILHPHQYDLEEYKQHIIDRDFTILAVEKLKHEFFFDHYILIAQKK